MSVVFGNELRDFCLCIKKKIVCKNKIRVVYTLDHHQVGAIHTEAKTANKKA